MTVTIAFIIFASFSNVVGQEYAKIKSSTVLTATAGNKLGDMGINYIENPTAVGKSINPIYIHQNNRILVGDSLNQRLQEFDMNGRAIREFLLPSRSGKIESISIYENNIYVLSGPRTIAVTIFNFDGKLTNSINLNKVGVLERRENGTTSLNMNRLLNGTVNKILLDQKGNIFVLGSDLIKINKSGKVLRRWGPNVLNFLFDRNNALIISYGGAGIEIYDSDYKLIRKFQQDIKGKFIGTEWNVLTWPEHIDANGNLYGFAYGKDMYLARYSVKNKLLKYFPIRQDDLIGASWTVASNGDIYYAETMRNFRVTKVVEVKE